MHVRAVVAMADHPAANPMIDDASISIAFAQRASRFASIHLSICEKKCLQSKKDRCNVRAHRSRAASTTTHSSRVPRMKPAFRTANPFDTSRFHRDADACALSKECGNPCVRRDNGTHHD